MDCIVSFVRETGTRVRNKISKSFFYSLQVRQLSCVILELDALPLPNFASHPETHVFHTSTSISPLVSFPRDVPNFPFLTWFSTHHLLQDEKVDVWISNIHRLGSRNPTTRQFPSNANNRSNNTLPYFLPNLKLISISNHQQRPSS